MKVDQPTPAPLALSLSQTRVPLTLWHSPCNAQVDQPTPAPAAGPAPTPAAPTKQPEQAGEGSGAAGDDDAMLDVEDPELAEALRLSLAEAQASQ